MSITSSTPNLQQLRSFWQRPEGLTGKVILIAVALGALYGFGLALPFIIALLDNTLHAMILMAAIVAVGMVATSKRVHILVSYVFKSVMRKLTGMFIEIDPIGILKNIIFEMKKNLAVMDEQISNVNGAIRTLTNTIEANTKDANHSMAIAAEASKYINSKDAEPIKAREYTLQKNNQAAHAGRLMQNNKSLGELRAKVKALYDTLVRVRGTAEAYIEDKEFKVSEETSRRKAVTSAFAAYKSALRILRGNPMENDLYDQTMEYLAEDAGMKLGEMEDFGRIAAKFVSTMDLETGAVQSEALQQLEAFEKKLLPGAPVEQEYIQSPQEREPVPVNYLDLK